MVHCDGFVALKLYNWFVIGAVEVGFGGLECCKFGRGWWFFELILWMMLLDEEV